MFIVYVLPVITALLVGLSVSCVIICLFVVSCVGVCYPCVKIMPGNFMAKFNNELMMFLVL